MLSADYTLLTRGLAAASAVFDRYGITPERAADARYNVEGWDISGFKGRISAEDLDLCGVWDEANEAALQVAVTTGVKAGYPRPQILSLSNFYASRRATPNFSHRGTGALPCGFIGS